MNIPLMRTFTKKELILILHNCSVLLEKAYQQTMEHDFFDTGVEASFASEYLQAELALGGNITKH